VNGSTIIETVRILQRTPTGKKMTPEATTT